MIQNKSVVEFMFSGIVFLFLHVDVPNYTVPDKDVPKVDRRKWLLELCVHYVQKFLINCEVQPLMLQMQKLDETSSDEFACRTEGCNKKYVHHSTRVK